MASQTPNWVPWQGPAPPPPPAPFLVNRGAVTFPPSPHPTIHDAEHNDMTDGSYSEDDSQNDSDEETGDGPAKATPNTGRPRESMAPTNLAHQGNHGVPGPPLPPGQGPPPGPPRSLGQGASLGVRSEIRNMTKEECMAPSLCLIYALIDVFCSEAGAEPNAA